MAKRLEVFTDQQLHEIWVTYNTRGKAPCPLCRLALVTIAEHPVNMAKAGTTANIRVYCPECGLIGTTLRAESFSRKGFEFEKSRRASKR